MVSVNGGGFIQYVTDFSASHAPSDGTRFFLSSGQTGMLHYIYQGPVWQGQDFVKLKLVYITHDLLACILRLCNCAIQ